MNLKKILSEPKLILKDMEYKHVVKVEDDYELKIKDSYVYKIREDTKKLIVKYKRTVNFEPSTYFSIKVEYVILWDIVEEKLDELEEILSKGSFDDINYIVYTSPEEVSLLIAQMTKAAFFPPLITPDCFILEDDDEDDEDDIE